MMTVEDTRYISLNTQHGISRPTSGNYVKTYLSHIDFNFTGLLKEEQDILYNHVDIVNCQIPVSFYNVNYASNILKYSINNGTIQTLTITVGNYSIASLKSEIKNQFFAAGYTFVISYNESTNKYLFSNALYDFSFFSNGSTILETIGFDSVANYSSTAKLLYSEHCCSLIGIKKLKISSVALATSSVSSGGGGDLLGIIPVNAGPREMITYSNNGNRKALLKNRIIDNIDIIIMDENNRYVNFNNNEFSLTLAITTTRVYKSNISSLFSNIQNPVLQTTQQQPVIPEGSSETNIPRFPFTDENDLDYFLYKKGINTG
jgi:hypothetical protein